jgi:hypothetical protein
MAKAVKMQAERRNKRQQREDVPGFFITFGDE